MSNAENVYNLFDTAEAITAEAINRAGTNADQTFVKAAKQAVMICVNKGDHFTTDQVWAILDGWNISTHDNRALGAVMRKASAKGIITNTGNYRKTERKESHRRPITVWAPNA